jgi:ABC-type Fe3+/spermidine/putrescine transport system ATPase subunit
VGITFVYVTHDQGEALTMSDRIGVMNEGQLAQVGPAEDVYESPQNLFVAGFVGEMCLLPAVVTEPGSVRLKSGEVIRARTSSPKGAEVTMTIRPEKLHIYSAASEAPPDRNALKGSIVRQTFYGEAMVYEVQIGLANSIEVRVENTPSIRRWSVGDQVVIDFHPEAAMALSE